MALVELLLLATLAQAQPADASSLSFSQATEIVSLDMGKLKGEPTRLAWSPDGSQFYLQTSEIKVSSRTDRHYVIAAGKQPQAVNALPDWAGTYWAWKSAQAAPAAPAFKIEVVGPETRTVRAIAAPMGGDLARGGTATGEGTSMTDATAAAAQSQTVSVISLRLAGETIGEFVNGPLVPGLTFGWAPKDLGVIAYTNKDGKVVVMDQQGRKKEVPNTSDARLPAWSDDGTKLAYLKKDGRRNYKLFVAGVVR